jgi:hypothetical protein
MWKINLALFFLILPELLNANRQQSQQYSAGGDSGGGNYAISPPQYSQPKKVALFEKYSNKFVDYFRQREEEAEDMPQNKNIIKAD